MMKKQLVLLLCLLMPVSIIAQKENSNQAEQTVTPKKLTKYEKFVEESGFFLKFQEYKLPLSVETATRGFWDMHAIVRRIVGREKYYFFITVINNEILKYAAIDYDDLLEINKALKRLLSEAADDVKQKPEYLENRYLTEDDFQIGYFIKSEDNKSKIRWFVGLDWRKELIEIKKIDDLVDILQMGLIKIEEITLKQKK